MTGLTKDEQDELLRLAKGGRFSGAARRMLMEFKEQRGWSDDELTAALQEASADQASEAGSSTPETGESTSE